MQEVSLVSFLASFFSMCLESANPVPLKYFVTLAFLLGTPLVYPVLRSNRERECLVVDTAVLRVVTCISFWFKETLSSI